MNSQKKTAPEAQSKVVSAQANENPFKVKTKLRKHTTKGLGLNSNEVTGIKPK